jgi:AAA domain
VTRAPVLYVALEGKDGFRKCMLALKKEIDDPGDWFALLTVHVALDKTKAGEAGRTEIIAAAKELEAKCGQPVGLIVIDTYARAIAGDDENSAAEAMAYLEKRAGEIIRKTSATVLTLYHPNKQGSLRGSTAQPAGLDFILRIDRQGACRKLSAEKVKDGEEGPLFDFELVPVMLGEDDEHEPITSCKVVPSKARTRLIEPVSEAGLREAFAGLEPTEGRTNDNGDVELPLKLVRAAFAKHHGGSKEATRKAFRRAAGALPGDFEISGQTIRRLTFSAL